MVFKIFYAWQSDQDETLCKDLIREALDKAATELRAELNIDMTIDQDTQDVPGSPSIPDTILGKIAASEAVVADLTLTHTSDKQVDPEKRGSNPNVMLEYGYAPPRRRWLYHRRYQHGLRRGRRAILRSPA